MANVKNAIDETVAKVVETIMTTAKYVEGFDRAVLDALQDAIDAAHDGPTD